MTKKEMVYEIVANTRMSNVSQRQLDSTINKLKKDWVEKVYNQFVNDKEKAYFYYSVMIAQTL